MEPSGRESASGPCWVPMLFPGCADSEFKRFPALHLSRIDDGYAAVPLAYGQRQLRAGKDHCIDRRRVFFDERRQKAPKLPFHDASRELRLDLLNPEAIFGIGCLDLEAKLFKTPVEKAVLHRELRSQKQQPPQVHGAGCPARCFHNVEHRDREFEFRFDGVECLVQCVVANHQTIRTQSGERIDFLFQQCGDLGPSRVVAALDFMIVDAAH